MQTTPITLDQPRALRFDYSALKQLEQAMNGVAVLEVIGQLQRCSLNAIETVLFVGLLHAEPTLTRALVAKRVKTFIQAGGKISDLVSVGIKALNDSEVFKNENEDAPEGNATPEVAQT